MGPAARGLRPGRRGAGRGWWCRSAACGQTTASKGHSLRARGTLSEVKPVPRRPRQHTTGTLSATKAAATQGQCFPHPVSHPFRSQSSACQDEELGRAVRSHKLSCIAKSYENFRRLPSMRPSTCPRGWTAPGARECQRPSAARVRRHGRKISKGTSRPEFRTIQERRQFNCAIERTPERAGPVSPS